ncbi:fatty acid desaturase [Fodinicurvata fenggangensis]|uniref:fatty acid desaturase n=1 Tax=Fodinicurvata fenggangensis TaxID=1121830 RepID=UPI000B07F8D3|nr:fatty acid desaturase [Fodinicurvata fenggangensis]
MIQEETQGKTSPTQAELQRATAPFQTPTLHESLGQLATSFGGFILTCAGMYLLAAQSYWLALLPAPLAALFLVRIFIIQHDCGHYSFFRSRKANNVTGFICGLLTLTPYTSWRRQHAGHHGIWNDLDRRQSGADIYSSCLTTQEYLALSPRQRWVYRTARHPLVANLLLPPLIFLLLYRLPFDMPRSWQRERRGVYLTNIALVGLVVALGLFLGFERVALVQLPVMVLAAIIGVWLFSVQHRSENTEWFRHDRWSAQAASLRGSTFLNLPGILRWFTGNIGYHHVHHLNPRVPNYRLKSCHEALPALQGAAQLNFREAMRALWYLLWDESREKMVTIRQMNREQPQARAPA